WCEHDMKGFAVIVAACLVVASGPAVPGERAVRKELEATLRAITLAVQHKDADAFASYLANDFTSTDERSTVHKRVDVIRDWTGMMQGFKNFKWQRHIKSLKRNGSLWVTVTDNHLSARVP